MAPKAAADPLVGWNVNGDEESGFYAEQVVGGAKVTQAGVTLEALAHSCAAYAAHRAGLKADDTQPDLDEIPPSVDSTDHVPAEPQGGHAEPSEPMPQDVEA